MKKVGIISKNIIFIIILLSLISFISAEIRINEIESNPSGSDSGNEWVELYSDQEVNLGGWKIINHDNESFNLSQAFNGFLVVTFNKQFLNNQNESLMLFNGESIVFSTPVLNDIYNDGRAWSYCSGEWKFVISTPGLINNNCPGSNGTYNPPQNQSPQNNPNNSTQNQIRLEIEPEEDKFTNGEEFKVKVMAYNLEDKKYDIKAWVYEDDDSKIMSETYDSQKKWVSSNLYYEEFFKGPGDKSKDIILRIKESERDFEGDPKIKVRIREKGSGSYFKEVLQDIEILKAKEENKSSNSNQNSQTSSASEDLQRKKVLQEIEKKKEIEKTNPITGDFIQLGTAKSIKKAGAESIKTNKNTVYESKNELIKKYSIYFFAFLLAVLVILLIFKRAR